MTVGLPVDPEEAPVFFMPQGEVTTDDPADQEGVPFSPTGVRTVVPRPKIQGVKCSIEYVDGVGKLENFGLISPSRVILTLLDEEYAQVKGFEFVVIGGNRYWYKRTETPKGLVSVGIYRVHCQAEDEG